MALCRSSNLNLVQQLIVFALACYMNRPAIGQGQVARTDIVLSGFASGGRLVLASCSEPAYLCSKVFSIDTRPGEPAARVLSRLAAVINQTTGYADLYMRSHAALNNDIISLAGVGEPEAIIIAGSETGLGIPKPPLFLTCLAGPDSGVLKVHWAAPPGGYSAHDVVKLYLYDRDNECWAGARFLGPDVPTSHVLSFNNIKDTSELHIWVKCYRHTSPAAELRDKGMRLYERYTPSNIAFIRISCRGTCLEEVGGFPFAGGILPNWALWSSQGNVDMDAFAEGDQYAGLAFETGVVYAPKGLLDRPYYQIIKAPRPGAAHGIYRKFLGLQPGHTYRLAACVSSLDMDSISADWDLSIHAIAMPLAKSDLTTKQMAGLEALPDGSRGKMAGRLMSWDKARTTRGRFHLAFTGRDGADHITMPADANTLVVWLRFSCSDPKGRVGFSGLRLEDITESGLIESAEAIKARELQAEGQLKQQLEQAKALRNRPITKPRP